MTRSEWHFEVVQIRCRRVIKYGDPYNSVANITITDGEPHVEGFLSAVDIKRKDITEITDYIKSLGYKSYTSSYFKNGKRLTITKKI